MVVVVVMVVVVEAVVAVRMSDISQGPGVGQSFVICAFSAFKRVV